MKPAKLKIKYLKGYVQSVENPMAKNNKVVYLVQKRDFTGWTPVTSKGKDVIGVKRGRTEKTAIYNVLKKGYKKVIFRD